MKGHRIARDVRFGGADGFDLRVNDWTMRGANGTDLLHARMTNGSYALDVTAQDAKGPVLQGGGQFSYGPGGSSYYYSRTRMNPTGTITVGTEVKQITGGSLWFDHQWGNFLPTNGGWDWFSTQMDDNSEMMIYSLRDAAGNVLQTFGEYVPPCSAGCSPAQPVPSIQLSQDQFTITPRGTWTSPDHRHYLPEHLARAHCGHGRCARDGPDIHAGYPERRTRHPQEHERHLLGGRLHDHGHEGRRPAHRFRLRRINRI